MTSIKVPPLGESIVEATVSRWMKKEGDQVSPGDTLVELETDKITVEVPAMSRGVLTKRLHAEGDVVKVDDLLGEIDESAAAAAPKREAAASSATAAALRNAPSSASSGPASAPTAAQLPNAPSAATPPSPAKPADGAKGDVRASPAAERFAAQQNVDLSGIAGTGRGGVVSKADVIEQTGSANRARTTDATPPAAPAPTQAPSRAPTP